MLEIWNQIASGWMGQTQLEIIAVITGILYLILAIKENIWCWFFAIISTGVSAYVMFDVKLISESILYIYYFAMAFYGLYQWNNGQNNNDRVIVSWNYKIHRLLIIATALLIPVLAMITKKFGASMPYLDAFTTCFAILATVMVAHKVLENWHYWLIVNSVSIYLYIEKDLYYFALMYILYLLMTIIGYMNWNKNYAIQRSLA